jgi:20S proteasome subunit beta 2
MPGFDFSNYNRNAALHARGVPLPKATSTGTTIVGCIFDGGVVVSDHFPSFSRQSSHLAR